MGHLQAQLAATMCQAIHKSQLAIATLLMRRGADIAQIYNFKEGVSSPLLLLINAAEVSTCWLAVFLLVAHNDFALPVWSGLSCYDLAV